jgi:hypothetical protein
MASPFAAYANATLRFPIASGSLQTDPETGNVKPAKSFLSVSAMLSQKSRPTQQEIPGVDISSVYLEGYAIEPMLLPSVVAPNAFCQATWDGKAGKFYLLLEGRSPYGVSPITGDKIKGYFQVAEFLVDGEPWTPDALPKIESEYESVEVDVPVEIGQPLYLKPNGHAGLAQADAIATSRICGLAVTAAAATTAASYSLDGTVERSDWTPITGTATLVPGATYYLSPDAAGKLTALAPEAEGQLVAIVGTALSTTKLAIEIQPPILL